MSGQFGLLKTRRFAPFFGTQFLGAFNDNCFLCRVKLFSLFDVSEWRAV
mgnify:CR=1 FL=1